MLFCKGKMKMAMIKTMKGITATLVYITDTDTHQCNTINKIDRTYLHFCSELYSMKRDITVTSALFVEVNVKENQNFTGSWGTSFYGLLNQPQNQLTQLKLV